MIRFSPLVALGAALLAGCATAQSPAPEPAPAVEAPQPDRAEQMVADLAALRFDRLGDPVLRWDHTPPVEAPRDQPHQLLVILVEYPDRKFDHLAGDPEQGDKLAAWYQEMLFDETYSRPQTLSHYYADQSGGRYHLTGKVLPPVTLAKPRGAYGLPYRPEGGMWRNDTDAEGMVEEAVKLAVAEHPELAWDDFDRWDPTDLDGDGDLGEPDGYLDHFVVVFAGGGQASCHLLNKLDDVLTPNAGPEALDALTPRQRECAERIWPHRFSVQKREGQGPTLHGIKNARGGVPMTDTLWMKAYNAQSEYVDASTFIHEFGHSIGLPDIYARSSSNSTGGWDVMSGTADPHPQSFSAWSRLQLGWLKPRVVLPPSFGGDVEGEVPLVTLDAPADTEGERAVLVVLPPKRRAIDLTELPEGAGKLALYSGQGNDLNRSVELRVSLPAATEAPLDLSFDAWWDIESGWDFAYLEVSADGGASWTRRLPRDRAYMPAQHGHDGAGTVPGFTGLSGDLDGDGKNESAPSCDPSKQLAHGEDKQSDEQDPCLVPSWVRPSFDLSDLAGQDVRIRLRYFTDMAAMKPGILIDNVTLTSVELDGSFEGAIEAPWYLNGFTASPGHHDVLVPHFYLLEYRDPYRAEGEPYRYDTEIARPRLSFWRDPGSDVMHAVEVRPRPGVVAWYFNGEFAWSENDPVDNGQGRGYLLTIDSNPAELKLPGLDTWWQGEGYTSHYDVSSQDAQAALKSAWEDTVCFVRDADYLPPEGLDEEQRAACAEAAVTDLSYAGRKLMYTYRIKNSYLPGPPREGWYPAGELLDTRPTEGGLSYRLRDRSLRYFHTLDAPFAAEPFEAGVKLFEVRDGQLVPTEQRAYPANPRFDDREQGRWMNPHLRFGGVDVPATGFSFEVATPEDGSAASSIVRYRFDEP